MRAAPARDAEHAHRPPKGIRANGRRGARARAGLPAGRILFLPLVLGAALFLSGCWSAREIDTLAFIMAVGLDRADEKELIVSYRIADPSSLAGGQSGAESGQGGAVTAGETTFNVSVKAETAAEAMERLRTQLPRLPFLSHVQGIIVGESLAREGVSEILDYFERDEDLRRSVHLFITKDVDAADIFREARPRLRTPSGLGFSEVIAQVAEVGVVPVARFGDLLEAMANPRRDAFAPAISLLPADATAGARADQVALVGTAIFRDDRMVGFLDRTESPVLQLLIGGIRQAIFDVGGEVEADVRVRPAGTRLRLVDPDNLRFSVHLRVRGDLRQLHTIGVYEGSELTEKLARELETELKEQIDRLIAKLQTLQSDVLSFGEVVYRSRPHLWKEIEAEWPEIFAQAAVDVTVEAVIVESGSILRALDPSPRRPNRRTPEAESRGKPQEGNAAAGGGDASQGAGKDEPESLSQGGGDL